MVDGTYKSITTTDGVANPTISSTTYPITYYAPDDVRVYRIVHWSDGTQYTFTTQEPRLQTSKLTVSGKTKQQFAFVGVSQYYNGVYQSKFPYITSVPPEIASLSTTETWSDSTTYTQVTSFETMIDGMTDKQFITNDGVTTPYITSTTYPITYVNSDTSSPTCYKRVSYSDNTSYSPLSPQARTGLADLKTISNVNRKQYSFAGVTEIDTFGQSQTKFPYIRINNSLPVVTYSSGQTQTQTWSDGRAYTKTW